ncbi:MAG: glycosyltransferase family 39 protein [Pseudomonadota bacterium]
MNQQWRDLDIRFWAVVASLLLSFLNVLLNPIPNADAFEYVRTAEIFLNDGLAAAYAYQPSATYAVAFGALHALTGLELFAAARLINALLFALLVYAFISLAREIRASERVTLLAAITILIFPQLNEYRYYLIRDIGFIALLLLGMLFLIRYGKRQHWQDAALFVVSTAAAVLFRSEALVYLPIAPLALLWNRELTLRARVLALVKIEAVCLLLGILGVLALLLVDMNIVRLVQRAAAVYLPFVQEAWTALSASSSPLSTAVFGEYASDFSGQYIVLFMTTGLAAILVFKLISGFGVPALLVLVYGLRQRSAEFGNPAMRVVLTYALIAFSILLGFLMLTRFMSTRYTLLFCTILLLMVPLGIDSALAQARSVTATRTMRGLLGFLALFCVIDAHFSFGNSKDFLEQASTWLHDNTDENAVVVTNSNYVAYHSERVEEYDKVARYIDMETLLNAPYDSLLALSMDRDILSYVDEARAFDLLELVVAFPPQGRPEFAIYRRTSE